MEKQNLILLLVGLISGIFYIISNLLGLTSILDFILKPLPIWMIAYYTWFKQKKLLTFGLLWGSLGDIFLINEEFFIPGLLAFLIGHLHYIIYFGKNFKIQNKGFILSFLILMGSLTTSFYIIPNINESLKYNIIIYISIITIMSISTTFYINFNYFAIIGSVLFLISDSIIAINKFVSLIPFAHTIIMISYYLGQWGIALGGSFSEKNSEKLFRFR